MIKGLKGKKKGFSLVELIVVIAIIGILAAIAVPKYSAYTKNAEKRAKMSTAKMIADAAFTASEAKEVILDATGFDQADTTEWGVVKNYLNKNVEIDGFKWKITKPSDALIKVELLNGTNATVIFYDLDI